MKLLHECELDELLRSMGNNPSSGAVPIIEVRQETEELAASQRQVPSEASVERDSERSLSGVAVRWLSQQVDEADGRRAHRDAIDSAVLHRLHLKAQVRPTSETSDAACAALAVPAAAADAAATAAAPPKAPAASEAPAEAYLALLTHAAELRAESRWDEAEPLLREALRLVRNRFGPEHFETHGCIAHLAHVQQARGNLPEAERLLRQVGCCGACSPV